MPVAQIGMKILENCCYDEMAGPCAGPREATKPVVIRVTPNRMISYDYAKDESGLFK